MYLLFSCKNLSKVCDVEIASKTCELKIWQTKNMFYRQTRTTILHFFVVLHPSINIHQLVWYGLFKKGQKHKNETTVEESLLITTIERAIIVFSTLIAQPHSMGFNAACHDLSVMSHLYDSTFLESSDSISDTGHWNLHRSLAELPVCA